MRLVGTLVKRTFTLADRIQGLGQTPFELQRKILRRLLKKAEYTAFGQQYDFAGALDSRDTIQAFQDRVPFFDYDRMHDEWWSRALNNEEDVSWPGLPRYFALSSGTTGAPSKYIPMTDDMIKAIRQSSLKTFFAATKFGLEADFFTKKGLFVSGTTSLKSRGEYLVGDMSGISLRERPIWVRSISKPGNRIQSIPDWNARIRTIARNAHKWDIGYLTGIPSWVQLMVERVIEYNKVDNIHEVWPNLRVFAHGGIAFEPHKKAFDALMGKPMIYIDTYLASEGYIAFQSRPDTRAMSLILNKGVFHEFIPFNDANFDSDGQLRGNPQAFAAHEIEAGVEYALAISTCAGSWRYLIGDTVKFTDAVRKELIITGRTKHFLSVTGEHLSVDNMNTGIRFAAETLETDVKEFTASAVETPSGFAHRWYIGCEPLVNATTFGQLLDDKLKEVNDDYTTERNAVLRDPQIEVVSPQLFYDYLSVNGKVGGQSKFPRVMKAAQFADWENFVAAKMPKIHV